MTDKTGKYILIASIASSIVIVVAFLVVALQKDLGMTIPLYTDVDIMGGMIFVFILSIIISISIWPDILEKHMKKNKKIVYYVGLAIIVIAAFYLNYYALVAPSLNVKPNLQPGEYEVKGSIVSVYYSSNRFTVVQEEIPGVSPAMVGIYFMEDLNGDQITDFVEGDYVTLILILDPNYQKLSLKRITKTGNYFSRERRVLKKINEIIFGLNITNK
jgi:hypothetical protein